MELTHYRMRASLLPAQTSTLAKSPVYANGIDRHLFAVSASGAYFTDTEGRRWLDMDMALGSVIWGHSPPALVARIAKQAALGICLSVPTVLEGELAERIIGRLHSFDQIQFAKNGSDVTTAAVRLARAITGRSQVLLGRYHGWHDWSAAHHYGQPDKLGINATVADSSCWLHRESAAMVTATFDRCHDIAAIVVCPEHWLPEDLQEVRRLATQHGALLIFDEVKAGMRFGRRGVCGARGIMPDLLCLGKGLANGLPLAALLGPSDLMRRLPDTRFSGTHATEMLSMAAAIACEDMLDQTKSWPVWHTNCSRLMADLSSAITRLGLQQHLAVQGYPGSFRIGAPDGGTAKDFQDAFVQALAEQDIFSRGYVVPSTAHTEQELASVQATALNCLEAWSIGRQHIRK
ncbi:MAG: aminotransferase class III-fold pyridoxal phosphate-dependent enzyme [Burkholderiaceae bacterium]|nr:aminotransferase class III-fold pyridoxal phosphate-dependent enzyme [Burkholderiaceae bacterium]